MTERPDSGGRKDEFDLSNSYIKGASGGVGETEESSSVKIVVTRQDRFLAASILLHVIVVAVLLLIPPKEPKKMQAEQDVTMLMLQRELPPPVALPQASPLPPPPEPQLLFQKPGPVTSQFPTMGLPPVPPPGSSPTPEPLAKGDSQSRLEPADAPPERTLEEEPPPEPEDQESSPLQAPPNAPVSSESPFTSSLEGLRRRGLGLGSPSGTARAGRGWGLGSRQLSGDASFTFDSGGFDMSEWAELVKLKVRSNWIIPTAARMGMKGIVSIDLVIEKDGRLSLCVVSRESGIVSMDTAAFNAVNSSSPLPQLPSGFPRKNLEATFTFFYNTYPRG